MVHDTGVNCTAQSDMGCSPSVSLSSRFPQRSFCSSLKEQAGPPLPLSLSHSLNSPSIFSSPLTSSPPHLTALCLCSSFSPAAGLGHSVWAVSISSPWGFSHLLFSKVSFFLSVSLFDLIQLFLTLSPLFCFFFILSVFYCLRQSRNQCVTRSSSLLYCVSL